MGEAEMVAGNKLLPAISRGFPASPNVTFKGGICHLANKTNSHKSLSAEGLKGRGDPYCDLYDDAV
jgi:hypothetical protein